MIKHWYMLEALATEVVRGCMQDVTPEDWPKPIRLTGDCVILRLVNHYVRYDPRFFDTGITWQHPKPCYAGFKGYAAIGRWLGMDKIKPNASPGVLRNSIARLLEHSCGDADAALKWLSDKVREVERELHIESDLPRGWRRPAPYMNNPHLDEHIESFNRQTNPRK